MGNKTGFVSTYTWLYARACLAIVVLGLLHGIAGKAIKGEDSFSLYSGDMAQNYMMSEAVSMNDDDSPRRGRASPMSKRMRSAPEAAPMMMRSASMSKMSAAESMEYAEEDESSTLGGQVLSAAGKVDSLDVTDVKTMLVRTGRVTIETKADLDKVAGAVASIVDGLGDEAFVERQDASGGWLAEDGKRRGRKISMTLRVPVAAFRGTMDKLTQEPGIGGTVPKTDLASSSESVRDVTGDYVDAAARERTLRATLEQLTHLMKNANEVRDVLQVQRELQQVTQQVEAKKAQMSRLSKSSALSTIHLELRQRDDFKPPPLPEKKVWSFFRSYHRAFKWLGHQLRDLTDVAIFTSVALIPLSFLAILLTAILGKRRLQQALEIFKKPPPATFEE